MRKLQAEIKKIWWIILKTAEAMSNNMTVAEKIKALQENC